MPGCCHLLKVLIEPSLFHKPHTVLQCKKMTKVLPWVCFSASTQKTRNDQVAFILRIIVDETSTQCCGSSTHASFSTKPTYPHLGPEGNSMLNCSYSWIVSGCDTQSHDQKMIKTTAKSVSLLLNSAQKVQLSQPCQSSPDTKMVSRRQPGTSSVVTQDKSWFHTWSPESK